MDIMERRVQTSVSLKLCQLEFVKKQSTGWLSKEVQGLIDGKMIKPNECLKKEENGTASKEETGNTD